jgi:hypothetical protein
MLFSYLGLLGLDSDTKEFKKHIAVFRDQSGEVTIKTGRGHFAGGE